MKKFIVGEKVFFEAYNHDEEKDMAGYGWIKEIDDKNNQIIIQTTRKLIWVQTEGVHKIC